MWQYWRKKHQVNVKVLRNHLVNVKVLKKTLLVNGIEEKTTCQCEKRTWLSDIIYELGINML